mmetsp:Transcript_8475/g.20405  ORF Transcript_8475/g.20405 Transcript_8475/m.20405 type:complete len:204 (-) Transcript_8475:84-695(-)
MDGVARNGDPIPPPAHGPVRGTPRLLQTEFLHLVGGRSDGGLLKDSSDACAGLDGIMEHLVLGVVASLAAQIVVLPLRCVNVGGDPLIHHEVAGVVRHFLSRNVHQRRCLHFAEPPALLLPTQLSHVQHPARRKIRRKGPQPFSRLRKRHHPSQSDDTLCFPSETIRGLVAVELGFFYEGVGGVKKWRVEESALRPRVRFMKV